MMCSVVVVIAVVAAAAQPFWKPAELNVGPVYSLTSDTAWLLSHMNEPFFKRRAGVTYQNRKQSQVNFTVQLITTVSTTTFETKYSVRSFSTFSKMKMVRFSILSDSEQNHEG